MASGRDLRSGPRRGVKLDIRDRPQQAHRPRPARASTEIEAEDEALVPAADADYDLAENRRALGRAFDTLPADQAAILRKAFLEDKSHSSIAAETGLPLGTVKSRARLGLARMRVLMAGWEP